MSAGIRRPDPAFWLLAPAAGIAAVMLLRLVYDLGRADLAFGGAALLFYALFLGLQALQLRALWNGPTGAAPLGFSTRLFLGLAVPVGLLGSVLDCMGLSFHGCSPVCAAMTRVVAPAVALFAVLHAWNGVPTLRLVALALPFVLLVPNCRCRNPVNRFWIDFFGLSPACFLSGFTVALVVASALVTGRHARLALTLAWGTNAVLMVFFVGHHYFHWPW